MSARQKAIENFSWFGKANVTSQLLKYDVITSTLNEGLNCTILDIIKPLWKRIGDQQRHSGSSYDFFWLNKTVRSLHHWNFDLLSFLLVLLLLCDVSYVTINEKFSWQLLHCRVTYVTEQGRNQLFISGGGQFSWNFIRWRHRAYSTVVQIFRKRSHIIIMYFCPQTRSPQYKHTHSAQRWLIKTNKTERFTTALEAESPVSSKISDFTPMRMHRATFNVLNTLRKLMIRA